MKEFSVGPIQNHIKPDLHLDTVRHTVEQSQFDSARSGPDRPPLTVASGSLTSVSSRRQLASMPMSYCLNPYCSRPQNPKFANFCSTCGFKLLLGDRYRALEPIGRGGFGRTFLAVDEYKPSRPPCVIKQFCPQSPNIANRERARELFWREAIQLEHLGQHPQIPELLAHFEQADYQYLVQEFIDGENLLQEVSRTGSFTDLQVWHLLNNLLPVLNYIHQYQVIHRDIKPQNIIRRPSTQQYVLVDFGAAKSIEGSSLSRTGTSIGSPEFTAPEQAIGKATYASDLYSLGVTCIYLLTRTRPADLFNTEEGCWIWRQHLHRPVNSVLADILDKLLQGPIKNRYQSAAEVLEDLHAPEILAALGISEPTPKPQPIQPLLKPSTIAPPALPKTVLPPTQPARQPAALWTCDRTLTGHLSWVRSVVVHPDNQRLASGSGDRTLKFWHLETGELLRSLPAHTGWVRAIARSSDGRVLASCSNDRTVKLWDWETGRLLHILEGHHDWVRSVAFSADDRLLASSSQDKTIRLWDVAAGTPIATLTGHKHWITSVTFDPHPDSDVLISGSRDQSLGVWNWRTGMQITVLEGHSSAINQVAISPDSNLLASASDDGTVRLWGWQNSKSGSTLTGHHSAVNAIAFSPDGALLASGSQDRTIKLWCVKTGTLLETLTGHTNWVWSVAFSPNSEILVSGGWDATIKVWRRTA